MPIKIKSYLARKAIKINNSEIEGIEFKTAETIDELDQAYKILGEAYKKQGYSNSQKRVLTYNTVENSATFIAKRNNEVIGTMSILPDNETFKLPLDSDYKKNIDKLRNKGHSIAEVSGLAIRKSERNSNQKIVMELNKIMLKYALSLKINNLIIGVNPKHEHIYRGVLSFKSLGKTHKNYQFVKGAPVVPLKLDIDKIRKYKNTYVGKKKALIDFFFKESTKYNFEKNKPILWNKKVWNHFIDDIIVNTPKSKRKQLLLFFNSL